jgi:hypothetical protein
MPSLPTVRVVDPKDPSRYVIINRSDYEGGGYVLWDEAPKAAAPQHASPSFEIDRATRAMLAKYASEVFSVELDTSLPVEELREQVRSLIKPT